MWLSRRLSVGVSRLWILGATIGGLVSSPMSASAGGIAVESVAGARDRAAAATLQPIFDELARHGYLSGHREIGKALRSRPSQVGAGLPGDFVERVDQAYRLWITGKFEEGRRALRLLIDEAHRNPAAVISNAKVGPAVFKALVGLAMCHHRLGDATAAAAAMAELLRSFDVEVTKGQYGAEAYTLYHQVKKEVREMAGGALSVRATSATAAIYLNERFAKIGEVSRTDLSPGPYRVVAQLGPDFGRAYDLEVKAGGKAELVVDPELERAVVTGEEWTGLTFRDRAERTEREVEAAARLGGVLGEAGVIVLGVDLHQGRTVAYGSLINASSGLEVRRASMAIEALPPPARLQALARFLVGAPTPLDGLEVHKVVNRPRQQPGAEGAPPPAPSSFTTRRTVALGAGVLGVGALVAGVVMHLQARDFQGRADRLCPEEQAGCARAGEATDLSERGSTRFTYALAAYGVATAATAGAIFFWWTGAPEADPDERASLAPRLTPRLTPGYAGLELMSRF